MSAAIFPKHPTADAYYIGGSYTPYAIVGVDKRFSEAELAAEYWRSREDAAYIMDGNTWEAMCGDWSISEAAVQGREYTLWGAAWLPHYDEADA